MKKSIFIILSLCLIGSIWVIPVKATANSTLAPAASDLPILLAQGPIGCISPVEPGMWVGNFKTDLNWQYTSEDMGLGEPLTQVYLTGSNEATVTGKIELAVECDGSVTGIFKEVSAQSTWEIEVAAIGFSDSGYCNVTAHYDVVSGRVESGVNGLPVFLLEVKMVNELEDCKLPQFTDMLLELGRESGGMTPTDPALRSYTLETSTEEEYVLTGHNPGFNDPFLSRYLPMISYIPKGTTQTSLKTDWQMTLVSPVLEGLSPEVERYFLEGIAVDNQYTASIDWRVSPPGTATFKLDDQEKQGEVSEEQATAVFNMGSVNVGEQVVAVHAISVDGYASLVSTWPVDILSLPPWAEELDLQPRKVGNQVIYEGKILLPEKPLEANVSIPAEIPIVGGDWGLLPTQLTVGVSATSAGGEYSNDELTSQGSISMGKYYSFDLQDFDLSSQTTTNMQPDELSFDSGNILIAYDIPKSTYSIGLFSLIPGASDGFGIPVVDQLLQLLNSATSLSVVVDPAISGQADLGVKNGQIEITGGSIKPGLTVNLTAGITETYDLLPVWVYAKGQGDTWVVIEVAPKPGIEDCFVGLEFEVGGGFLGYPLHPIGAQWQHQCAMTYHRPPGLARSAPKPASIPQPEATDLPKTPPAPQLDAVFDLSAVTLAEDVHFRAAPRWAVREDGKMALVWVDENRERPGSGLGILYLRLFDGQRWTDPVAISSGEAFLSNPVVEYDQRGNLLVVWNQYQGPPLSTPIDLAQSFFERLEITYAVIDPQTGEAKKEGSLTDDARLDFSPQLARGGDGTVWLIWQSSSGGLLIGAPAQPNQLTAVRWEGNGWSTPEIVAQAFTGALYWEPAAQSEKQIIIIADQDTDGDLTTAADREIFVYERLDDWEAKQLTINDLEDSAPHAAYTPEGVLLLVWRQGMQALGVRGGVNEPVEAWLPAGYQIGRSFVNARLVAGADGEKALLWPGSDAMGSNLLLAKYDPQTAAWGSPVSLFPESALATSLSVKISTAGALLVGLTQTNLGDDSGVGLISSFPGGASSLVLLELPGQFSSSPWSGSGFPEWRDNLYSQIVLSACGLLILTIIGLTVLWQIKCRRRYQ